MTIQDVTAYQLDRLGKLLQDISTKPKASDENGGYPYALGECNGLAKIALVELATLRKQIERSR